MNINPSKNEIDFVREALMQFNNERVGADGHTPLNFVEYDANGNVNANESCDSSGSIGISFAIPEITATAINAIDNETSNNILKDFVLNSLYKSILMSLAIVVSSCNIEIVLFQSKAVEEDFAYSDSAFYQSIYDFLIFYI